MSKLAHSNNATMAIIASQNCGDCCGKSTICFAGEEYPCPTCRPGEFEDAATERRVDLEAMGMGLK